MVVSAEGAGVLPSRTQSAAISGVRKCDVSNSVKAVLGEGDVTANLGVSTVGVRVLSSRTQSNNRRRGGKSSAKADVLRSAKADVRSSAQADVKSGTKKLVHMASVSGKVSSVKSGGVFSAMADVCEADKCDSLADVRDVDTNNSRSLTVSFEYGEQATEMGPDGIAEYSMNWDDATIAECRVALEHVALSTEDSSKVAEKFDTACSRCVSGVPGRIQKSKMEHNIYIKGFNDSQSPVTDIGVNSDGKTEYYVDGMPRNLVLLCANDYTVGGAAVLFQKDGVVFSLDGHEQEFRDYISKFPVIKRLRVQNRTYEVDEQDVGTAFASTNYFNTGVNVSTKRERVLTYLLTGLSLRDLQFAAQHKSIAGIHPDMAGPTLSNFERTVGRTPDVVQAAYNHKLGNVKALETKPHVYTHVGELIEIDNMEMDYNEVSSDVPQTELEKNSLVRKKVSKLKSHGGAIGAHVVIDRYSEYPSGMLFKSTANPVDMVRQTVEFYKAMGHKVDNVAADRGIINPGKFRVVTDKTKDYLHSQGIRVRGAEPGNHSNGTPLVERVIQPLRARMAMAMMYILRNPNRKHLPFSDLDLRKLWGEIFHWALFVVGLMECPNVPGKTRYEVFTGKVPNIQEMLCSWCTGTRRTRKRWRARIRAFGSMVYMLGQRQL